MSMDRNEDVESKSAKQKFGVSLRELLASQDLQSFDPNTVKDLLNERVASIPWTIPLNGI